MFFIKQYVDHVTRFVTRAVYSTFTFSNGHLIRLLRAQLRDFGNRMVTQRANVKPTLYTMFDSLIAFVLFYTVGEWCFRRLYEEIQIRYKESNGLGKRKFLQGIQDVFRIPQKLHRTGSFRVPRQLYNVPCKSLWWINV